MSNLELRHVDHFTDRFGRMHYYFRRGHGPRITLPGSPGAREFMDAYADALAASEPRPSQVEPRQPPAAGTFAALARLYFETVPFKRLAPRTAANYRSAIDRFVEQHGHRKVAQMRYQHVAKIVGDMQDHPGAAVNLLKRISAMCGLAIKLGWITANPAVGVETFEIGERHTWTEAEIAQYEGRWPLGTRQRLAFDTLIYTGQRVSDAVAMPVPDRQGKMRFTQQKTGVEMTLAAHPRLSESITATGISEAIILPSERGTPYKANTLSSMMADAIEAAGLPERCVAHGLRKAAARRLAEIGCSAHEIMALTGHQTLAQVQHYTKAVDQERLNAQAMARLTGQKENA